MSHIVLGKSLDIGQRGTYCQELSNEFVLKNLQIIIKLNSVHHSAF